MVKAKLKLLTFSVLMITLTAWTAYAKKGNVVGLMVVVDFPDLKNGASGGDDTDLFRSNVAGSGAFNRTGGEIIDSR